jgi:hypothetical protein
VYPTNVEELAGFYVVLIGGILVFLLLIVAVVCCCVCWYCIRNKKALNFLPQTNPNGLEAVGSALQQPQTEQRTTEQRQCIAAPPVLPRASQELHANEEPEEISDPAKNQDSALRGSAIFTSDHDQNVPSTSSLHLGSSASPRTEGPTRTQSTVRTQSSRRSVSGVADPNMGGLRLARLYQAAFPSRESTSVGTKTVAGAQQAPGPDASSECKQDYVQYQLDSLGAAEVLDGLMIQQGMRNRLLGGMFLSLLLLSSTKTCFCKLPPTRKT